MGRISSRLGAWLVVVCLPGCAQPENDLGASGNGVNSACAAPSCNGCKTCVEMCKCTGSSPVQCSALCATGTGGKAGSGGAASGGSGGLGIGGSTSFGGSGGYGTGGYGTGGFGSGGYAGGSSCSVALPDPACNTCMQSQCCTEMEGCALNNDCMGLMDCIAQAPACQSASTLNDLLTCGDTACPAQSSGKQSLSAYLSCVSTRCASACGMM